MYNKPKLFENDNDLANYNANRDLQGWSFVNNEELYYDFYFLVFFIALIE